MVDSQKIREPRKEFSIIVYKKPLQSEWAQILEDIGEGEVTSNAGSLFNDLPKFELTEKTTTTL